MSDSGLVRAAGRVVAQPSSTSTKLSNRLRDLLYKLAAGWCTPAGLIVAFLIACCSLLSITTSLPLGAYYWDLILYPDAAWRIRWGQAPFVDFFAPVGAYGYYAYVILEKIFPNGHMALLVNWTILLVATPLALHVANEVAKTSRAVVIIFTVVFIVLAAMPLNASAIFPMPAVDGYGAYNRHVVLLLYILVGELALANRRTPHAVFLGVILLALFHLKITGFLVACGIVVHGILAGRIRMRK